MYILYQNIFNFCAHQFLNVVSLDQMYVPGKLKSCDKVLVDIGTGYYVEKVRSPCCNWVHMQAAIIIIIYAEQ